MALRRSERLLAAARAAKGFMPDDEGCALARLAERAARAGYESIVEVGAYCGRSTLYLASGVAAATEDHEIAWAPADRRDLPQEGKGPVTGRIGDVPATVVLSVDHHHGSEENQAGWEHHDPSLVDPTTGRIDTLLNWRSAVERAGAEDLAIAVVGDSRSVARRLGGDVGVVFIDGGHGEEPAWSDYRGFAPLVRLGGWLAIHDVFEDPSEGGRPPFEIWCAALASMEFEQLPALGCGSLKVLRRIAEARPAGGG